MVTESVIAGSALVNAIVCGPAPGILKAMVSPELNAAFASRMACRNEPGPESAVVVTMNDWPVTALLAAKHGPNSDVLPNGSVAVAQINLPSAGAGKAPLKIERPFASVVTVAAPRYCCPSPLNDGSAAAFA